MLSLLKNMLVVLAFTLGNVSGASADAAMDKALDAIAESSGSNGIVNYIKQTTTTNKAEEWMAITDWLQRRVLKKDPDPFYALLHSDLLSNYAESMKKAKYSEDKVRAAYAFSYGQLRSYEMAIRIDAARCADPSVVDRIPVTTNERYANFRDIKKTFTAEDWNFIGKTAIMYESVIANRPPNKKLCASGIRAMQAALAQPTAQLSEKQDANNVGKTFTVKSDPNYQPEYISDADWQIKRQEIIRKFQKRLTQEQKI